MRTPKITVTKETFENLLNERQMKEAVEGVYVNKVGTSVYEVQDIKTIGNTTWIIFIERCISKNNAGYMQCGCKKSTTLVHRLVAKAWLDNPNNYNEVDHIDGDKTNNSMYNLVWTTHAKNMQAAWDNGQISRNKTFAARYNKKLGILRLADGTKLNMSFEDYINWRIANGYRVDNILRNVEV